MSDDPDADRRTVLRERSLLGKYRGRAFRAVVIAAIAMGLVAVVLLFW